MNNNLSTTQHRLEILSRILKTTYSGFHFTPIELEDCFRIFQYVYNYDDSTTREIICGVFNIEKCQGKFRHYGLGAKGLSFLVYSGLIEYDKTKSCRHYHITDFGRDVIFDIWLELESK